MFYMYRHTIVAPDVTNDGTPSGYPHAFRVALEEAGISGWTEYETTGVWRGKDEPGVTFEIYLNDAEPHKLGTIARRVMPDQEAIQVTVEPTRVELYEF